MTKAQLQAKINKMEKQIEILAGQRATLLGLCNSALSIADVRSKSGSIKYDNINMSMKSIILEYDSFLKENK